MNQEPPIPWDGEDVRSAIAYLKAGDSTEVTLIEFEFVISVIFLVISILMKDKTK